MSLRDEILERLRSKELQKDLGAILAQQYQALSNQEKKQLVKLLIDSPCDGGRALKRMILTAIDIAINAQADSLLAGGTINKAEVEAIFSEI